MTEYRVVWGNGADQMETIPSTLERAAGLMRVMEGTDARIESREITDWTTLEASDGK